MKEAVSTPPVLAYPDFTKNFIIQTDASDVAVGAVLTQIFDDGEHPISYASSTLSAVESRYSAVEKECLAVRFGIDQFHTYIEGRKFTIQTDHAALEYLDNMKTNNNKLWRWKCALAAYDFNIKHRPGKENSNADALSRPPFAITNEILNLNHEIISINSANSNS